MHQQVIYIDVNIIKNGDKMVNLDAIGKNLNLLSMSIHGRT
jgi:hypothetical protein